LSFVKLVLLCEIIIILLLLYYVVLWIYGGYENIEYVLLVDPVYIQSSILLDLIDIIFIIYKKTASNLFNVV